MSPQLLRVACLVALAALSIPPHPVRSQGLPDGLRPDRNRPSILSRGMPPGVAARLAGSGRPGGTATPGRPGENAASVRPGETAVPGRQSAAAASSGVNETDSLALVALYNAAGGPGWFFNDGWLTEEVIYWYGVTVINDRVTALYLDANNLVGAIPAAIGDLTALQYLDMGDFDEEEANYLSGPIPTQIGSLTQLVELNLGGNLLTGSIPSSIGGLALLEDLTLGNNQLSGSIPASLGSLSSLEFLDLSGNALEGAIPKELGSLSMLESLILGFYGAPNRLEGTIPPELGNLASLEAMFLAENRLEGEIPASLGNLSNLYVLSLHGNRLTGTIPPSLGNLSNLFYLDLGIIFTGVDGGEVVTIDSPNDLSGPIPAELGRLTNMRTLLLSGNQFTGDLPSAVASWTLLETMLINCNRFEGLPNLSGLQSLVLVDVSSNRLEFDDVLSVASRQGATYAPQASLTKTVTSVGGQLVLSVTVAGAGNSYQWYAGSSPVAGGTGRALTIPGNADASLYHVRVTNPGAPALTLTTEPNLKPLVVNVTTDASDASETDALCDSDLQTPGSQCSLRAALEVLEKAGLGRCACDYELTFALPGGGSSLSVSSPLPEVGRTVLIDGGSSRTMIQGFGAGGDGLRVMGSDVRVRRLGLAGFSGYAVRFVSGGGHSITGSQVLAPTSALGGIRVDDGVASVTIGGLSASDENEIQSGISLMGEARAGIRVLRNRVEVPLGRLTSRPLLLPIDRKADGPTCASWTDPTTVPPPRVLGLTTTEVSGFAQALSTVIAYTADAAGAGDGRYWAAAVSPVGVATSGADGAFTLTFDSPQAPGATIVLGSIDSSGRTSELTPIRRPVIYLPGVGGTWLKSTDNDYLFISIAGAPDFVVRNRLDRLRMNEAGTAQENGEAVIANEILDGAIAGVALPYRPVLVRLEASGYVGNTYNTGEPALDLWRFPYDWRLQSFNMADRLRDLIDHVTTGQAGGPAAACDVDVVTHSNGGMVASAYVMKHRDHSRNKVARLLMNAAPYLGSPQVAAAHTRGYLFEIDETDWVGPDLHWGRMTRLFQNLPNGYGLMPSRAYFDIVDATIPWQTTILLSDLYGRLLAGYDESFAFLTRPKFDANRREDGLGRNAALWTAEQNTLHALVNDWRQFAGPPQVFRHVGSVESSSVMGWSVPSGLEPPWRVFDSDWEEEGDGAQHIVYRESLQPRVLGWGDGTVPLVSATLGRGMAGGVRVGREDRSGVDESPWIEEFEYFPCRHVPMVSEECGPNAAGARPLPRMIEILRGASVVPAPGSGKAGGSDGSGREVFFVNASGPVGTHVEGAGGSVGPAEGSGIVSQLPEVSYWAGPRGAVVSVPRDRAYALRVAAGAEAVTVRVSRQSASATGDAYALFGDAALAAGGSMRLDLSASGTAPGAAFAVDADGNGSTESTLAPAVQQSGTPEGGGLPTPSPVRIDRVASLGGANLVETVTLPQPGSQAWSWQLLDLPSWVTADRLTGTTPVDIRLTLAVAARPEGVHEALPRIRVALGAYSADLSLPIRLAVRSSPSALTTVTVGPTGVGMAKGESFRFWAEGRDQYGLAFPLTPTWSATGGTVTQDGTYTAGSALGTFTVTATGPGGVSGSVQVQVASGVRRADEADLPTRFGLEPVYPNPFNPAASVPFSVPAQARVRLELYDLIGRHVDTLVDEDLPPGRYLRRIDASRLPSGVYLVVMTAGAFRAARPIALIR